MQESVYFSAVGVDGDDAGRMAGCSVERLGRLGLHGQDSAFVCCLFLHGAPHRENDALYISGLKSSQIDGARRAIAYMRM